MDKFFYRVSALLTKPGLVLLFALSIFAPSFLALARGSDLARVVEQDGEDVFEKTIDGTVVGITIDGVEFEAKSKKTTTYPPERVVWLMFEGEPLELSSARVELEVGNYEEALEKLNAIDPKDLDAASENAKLEIAWDKALATTRLAFSGAGELGNAGRELSAFVKSAGTHYRYYEANALLGDVCRALDKGENAEKYYAVLDGADSESTRARGAVGRGELALASGDAKKAKEFFGKVVGEELKPLDEGAEVRVAARIGLARAEVADSNFDAAEKILTELLTALPNGAALLQARTNVALGDALARAGKAQEAIVAYLRVDLLYPEARTERVAALKGLVPLWRAVGREDRAAETIERLRERFEVEVE